jgi:valyl-tRNA synthetase
MAYFYQNSAGGSYVVSNDKLKNFKQFNNKIWNATRFVLMRSDKAIKHESMKALVIKTELAKRVVEHITGVKKQITKNMDAYEFGHATETLYEEFWHTFCDKFIEESKKYLLPKYDENKVELPSEFSKEEVEEVAAAMLFTLKEYLKMLHPFIPFITEKIWQEIPKSEGDHKSLMYTRWGD